MAGFYCSIMPTLQLTASTVMSNSAGNQGGGLYNDNSSLLIRNTLVQGNDAFWGGGLANLEGSPQIYDSTFTGNSAVGVGGGLYSDGGSTRSEPGRFLR